MPLEILIVATAAALILYWPTIQRSWSELVNAFSSYMDAVLARNTLSKLATEVEKKVEEGEEADSKPNDWDDYYKKGRPEGGNPREDTLLRKDTKDIKSEDFKEFLEGKGETPSKWKKVMETWETPEGDTYERHYWTNGTSSYYHD